MGEKKSKKQSGGEDKKSGEVQKKEGGGGKEVKNDGKLTVVLKSDFHCDACVSKFVKVVRGFQGVDEVTCDGEKVTVIGKVDPMMLKEKLEDKTHKSVQLVSPVPPKKDGKGKEGDGAGAGDGKEDNKKKQQNKEKNSKKENKKEGEDNNKKTKEKEPPITTTVLKVYLHCQGCIQKIQKIVSKTKGYKEMKLDKQKDLVTVTGSVDVKQLIETLKKHLKREVEIVPQKKEGGENKEKGGDKKEKAGGGDGGGGVEKAPKSGEGKGKNGGEGGGGGGGGGDGGQKMMMMMGNVGNGMHHMQQVPYGYPYPYMYAPGPVYGGDQFQNPYPVVAHHPQLFSDENPNACSVM